MFDVIVIGGGIIGLTAAFRLSEAGRKVLILDRKGMAEETSRGNAGAFAFADVEPLASPGVIWKAPFWLMDPLGPLSMPLGHAPKMLPWMWRFWRASRPARHEASTAAQARLMELAKAETDDLFGATGLAHHLRRDGAIYLYEGERALKASRGLWDLRARHGVEFETVTGARLAELQPGLHPKYTHGVFIPAWMTLSDPYEVACAIGRAALARGAAFERGEVADLSPNGQGVSLKLTDGRRMTAPKVILACGAWSHHLAAKLGDKVPLETERGYNTTLPPGAFDLKRQLVLPQDGYVVTPLSTGIRVGGAVELAGLTRPPDFRRAEILLKKAEGVMPGLKTEGGTQWMGFRPSLPDTLPIIGRAPRAANVVYAFGHGHLGLTQAAATARLLTDLVLGRTPAIDLTPYRPERF
ncbi:MAG: FAD-dependent oxidoreductase [Paracoccaceae bacterium]